ncbi:hypothetical protein TEA_025129 [Camellia sinensis var. sinensis]|uniref:Biogenesis factor required for ATP synthase 1-like C-terminal domain-containing protein n=1 Tax=Camellia sinensis var. sinensis TaxID=542762 RepID=A0A4S4DLY1_CAMSN|nr:hypothetical protein TEA_025129 [Camellia sinensis var. sinensis]
MARFHGARLVGKTLQEQHIVWCLPSPILHHGGQLTTRGTKARGGGDDMARRHRVRLMGKTMHKQHLVWCLPSPILQAHQAHQAPTPHKNLKLPSRWPSIVCENCLYSLEKDMRARAFHIMDPKGIIEMLLIFLEERGGGVLIPPSFDDSKDNTNRILPYLGMWKGHSITKRSGVYGSTITEADTIAVLEIDDDGWIIQDITSTSSGGNVTTNVHWTGTMSNNLINFDGGFQVTLLPGGMYMGCPSNVAKSVADSKSFHLEFCWLKSPGKRQRLVRTYDIEGLAVSSTYSLENKL